MAEKQRRKRATVTVEGISKQLLQNHPPPDSPISSDCIGPEFESFKEFRCESNNYDIEEKTNEDSHENCSIDSFSNDGYYDKKMADLVKQSYEAINTYLYEGETSELLSQSIIDECEDWNLKFPHLRIVGQRAKICGVEEGESKKANCYFKNGSSDDSANTFQETYEKDTEADVLHLGPEKTKSVHEEIGKADSTDSSLDESCMEEEARSVQSDLDEQEQQMYDQIMNKLVKEMFRKIADNLESQMNLGATENKKLSRRKSPKSKIKETQEKEIEKTRKKLDGVNLDGILSVTAKLLQDRGTEKIKRSLGVVYNGSTVHAPASMLPREKHSPTERALQSKCKNQSRSSPSQDAVFPPLSKTVNQSANVNKGPRSTSDTYLHGLPLPKPSSIHLPEIKKTMKFGDSKVRMVKR